jgi:hypothetical protein
MDLTLYTPIGIDISKLTFDVCIDNQASQRRLGSNWVQPNKSEGLEILLCYFSFEILRRSPPLGGLQLL